MQTEVITKYGQDKVSSFWNFIDELKFDTKSKEAATARLDVMRRLSPTLADTYKNICDELAFSLVKNVYQNKKGNYIYAAFDAVSKGSEFYDLCWKDSSKIQPILDNTDPFNNFGSVIPTEDDYFSMIIPSPESIQEDFEEYCKE